MYSSRTGDLSCSRLSVFSLLLLSCFVWHVDASCSDFPYLARLNYGFAARCVKPIRLTSGHWHHTFHTPLPIPQFPRSTHTDRDCLVHRNSTTHVPCQNMQAAHKAFADLTHSLQSSLAQSLEQIYATVTETSLKSKSGARTRRNIFGDAISWMTGLTKKTDVQAVKDAMRKVAQDAQIAATYSSRTREGMAAFIRLSNIRIDTMHRILNMTQKTQREFFVEMTELGSSETSLFDIIGQGMRQLRQFVRAHDEVISFLSAIHDLTQGRLSQNLFHPGQLQKVLDAVERNLTSTHGTQYKLIHQAARETYAHSHYDVTRLGMNLVVVVHLPFSAYSEVAVYEVFTFPHVVPGIQGLVTELEPLSRYVIQATSYLRDAPI